MVHFDSEDYFFQVAAQAIGTAAEFGGSVFKSFLKGCLLLCFLQHEFVLCSQFLQ